MHFHGNGENYWRREGKVLESKPIRVEENSRLRINEERTETILYE